LKYNAWSEVWVNNEDFKKAIEILSAQPKFEIEEEKSIQQKNDFIVGIPPKSHFNR